MSNKIAFIQGSPRKNGNTRAITAIAIASAKEEGAKVTEIDVTNLNFKEPGCVGCQKCQQSQEYVCAFNDDIAKSVATLPDYNVIVLATPLYWWSYSAQLKIYIDRMYSLSKISDLENYQSLLAGKTLALLATAGGPFEDNLELLEYQWKKPANMLGCLFVSCLFPDTTQEAGMLVGDPSAVEKAKAFGRSLALT
ncbi:MAG: flavodoxin family protein [Desulfatitalea sp.]|nr:flavodoxin family protein [Desulfatitalea sp.]NNJ98795.1 flavodoxin family protein [Desulfatitalea sp.]